MILQERTAISSPLRVDREKGIIHGVKIIGTASANNRRYPVDMLAKAAPLYEDATVNVDHPQTANQARGVADTFGAIRNVSVKASGDDAGLYGDLHYLKSHKLAESIAEAAERFPNKVGLSHNADGTGRREKDGSFLVESISRVISVDVVKDPATNKSLFEGVDSMKLRNFKLSEIVATLPAESSQRKLLSRLIEEGAMSGDTVASAEEQPGPEEAIKAAFRAEIIKAFDDSSLDAKATLARIKEVIKAHEKVQSAMAGTKASEGGDAKPEGDSTPAATPESKSAEVGTLLEEVKLLRARDEVRTLLQEAKKEVTTEQFDALVATPAAHRKTLLEAIGTKAAPQGNGTKPRTVGTTPATGGDKPPYEKGKRFMEHLRRAESGVITSMN